MPTTQDETLAQRLGRLHGLFEQEAVATVLAAVATITALAGTRKPGSLAVGFAWIEKQPRACAAPVRNIPIAGMLAIQPLAVPMRD